MQFEFPTFRRFGRLLHRRLGIGLAQRPQRRSLLRMIAVAGEQQIPLAPLLSALAADEQGRQRIRVARLATLLSGGVPLADAVEQLPGVLNDEDELAIRLGQQSGSLSRSLRERLATDSPATSTTRQLRSMMVYYAFVFVLIALPITFYMHVFITPALDQIDEEFDKAHAPAMQFVMDANNWIAHNAWLLLAATAATVYLFASSRSRRWLHRHIAPLGLPSLRVWRDAAFLDHLATASAAGRPLAGAISTLGRYHYDRKLRQTLLFVRNEVEQGADLWSTLAESRLLSPREVQALGTSDQLGNRAWLLHQLAELRRRRVQTRLEGLTTLLALLIVIAFGLFVLVQALAMFQMLNGLTHELA